MNLKGIRDDLRRQASDLDTKIQAAKDAVQALQAEKASVKADLDDVQAYLSAKGTP